MNVNLLYFTCKWCKLHHLIQPLYVGRCIIMILGFPGGSEVKASASNAGGPGSIPGVGKIPWRRKWQPTLVFLPGESHGQRSLVGYNPRVAKSRTRLSDLTFTFIVDLQCCSFCCTTDWISYTYTHTYIYILFYILFYDRLSQGTEYIPCAI